MSDQHQTPASKIYTAMVVGAFAYAGWNYFEDVWRPDGEINAEAALAAFIFWGCVVSFATAASVLTADALQYLAAKTPRRHKGKAGWATWRELRRDVLHRRWGPYWGVYAGKGRGRGKPLFIDYSGNALTVGTAGSGKGICVVLPTCMAIHDGKLLPDFKGVNSCMLKKPLTERGEIFREVNLGDMHTDILGESDCYNPSEAIVAADFLRPGGICDVVSDCAEIAFQLYPDPPAHGGGGDDKFWRDGSRDVIAFGIRHMVAVKGPLATLGDVNLLVNDRAQLLRDCLWACGRLLDEKGNFIRMPLEAAPWAKLHDPQDVRNFIEYHRAHASGLADELSAQDNKTMDSFLSGAKQAMEPFNVTSRAHKVMSRSTFRFGEMKEGKKPVNVAIVIDASRLATQSRVAALVQWCAMTEWKRHPNKDRPVYIIHDETTNGKFTICPRFKHGDANTGSSGTALSSRSPHTKPLTASRR